MKQFLESLFLFQLITSSSSPVMKISNKALRVLIFSGIFSLLFAY